MKEPYPGTREGRHGDTFAAVNSLVLSRLESPKSYVGHPFAAHVPHTTTLRVLQAGAQARLPKVPIAAGPLVPRHRTQDAPNATVAGGGAPLGTATEVSTAVRHAVPVLDAAVVTCVFRRLTMARHTKDMNAEASSTLVV